MVHLCGECTFFVYNKIEVHYLCGVKFKSPIIYCNYQIKKKKKNIILNVVHQKVPIIQVTRLLEVGSLIEFKHFVALNLIILKKN